jgi:threonine synthase
VLAIRGSLRRRARELPRARRAGRTVLVNSLNPHRLEGQKTAAFEIVEELGPRADVLALPYGGGGNTVAYAKGFARRARTTRLVGGQSTDARDDARVGDPDREPAHLEVVTGSSTSGARDVTVSTSEITDAWLEIASREGIFCEPSSAAGLAAMKQLELDARLTVVVACSPATA